MWQDYDQTFKFKYQLLNKYNYHSFLLNILKRSYKRWVILCSAYSHLCNWACTWRLRVIFAIVSFYNTEVCFSSGSYFSFDSVDKLNNSFPDKYSWYFYGSSLFYLINYCNFTPWSKTVTKSDLKSIYIFWLLVATRPWVESTALKAEAGLLSLILDCGLPNSS